MDADDDRRNAEKALTVLRAWAGGQDDNLPVALHEAELIIEQDGGPQDLLAGMITLAGFLLVNLEQRGQSAETTLALLEAFVQAQGGEA